MTSVVILPFLLALTGPAYAEDPASIARTSLQKYFRAWGEPDVETRKSLLSSAWAEKGTYTDPTAHVDGRDALVKHIGEFLTNPQFKGATIVQTSGIDFHHQSFRFEWAMNDSSGGTMVTGMDYGEFDNDGKITRIVGFFGPFPEKK
jgi:hypothetical protein